MSYITLLGTATPPHRFDQTALADFMVRSLKLPEDAARKLRALYRATGIESRYSVLDDYGKKEGFRFFPDTEDLEPFPTTKTRLEFFRQHSLTLSLEAIHACLKERTDTRSITHLIAVSCTGFYAPGLDIELVKALKLNTHIHRTCINFMGCYAAFNAIKLADSFCKTEPEASVLIVCCELCSLHFQKEPTENNLLANALFADGAAALLVESKPRQGINLKPESFYCDLAPEGEQDMAWSVGDLGFEMRLTSYVPAMIRQGIGQLTKKLLSKISHDLSDVDYFAVHPGGKKILEAIEEALGLRKEQNQAAYEVLRKYGNMSSPTVLFVLHELCSRFNGIDDNKLILSFAFGPGLTLESMLLKIENR